MNRTLKIKISIDVMMTIAMFFLMCYPYTGNENHEIVGAVLLVLFIVHQVLNRNWYKNLIKGKYKALRILQTVVDISMLIVMFLQMISGISMSGCVFTFVPFGFSVTVSRTIHMVCAYLGFLIMGFHVGLHYGMILNMVRKLFHLQKKNKNRTLILRIISGGIALYGIYAMVKRDFIAYISMEMHFAFFDYQEPVVYFILDYFAIMITMIFLAYFMQKLLMSENEGADINE